MIYLSKGILLPCSTKNKTIIIHCGKYFELADAVAKLWLDGRYQTKRLQSRQEKAFQTLLGNGLAETADEADEKAVYRILTNCVICSKPKRDLFSGLSGTEKILMTWISSAGIKLTVAELVYLTEQKIIPTADLLGETGIRQLIWTLYAKQPAIDCILETLMETSPAYNETTNGLLSLLRKKKLVII